MYMSVCVCVNWMLVRRQGTNLADSALLFATGWLLNEGEDEDDCDHSENDQNNAPRAASHRLR